MWAPQRSLLKSKQESRSQIPKLIHKIWVNGPASTIPKAIEEVAIASWTKHYPDFKLVIWDKLKLEELMRLHYPVELQAFEDIKPLAYKCDVARLCVLHRFGGIYSDLKQLSLERMEIGNAEYVLTRDRNMVYVMDEVAIQNCFMGVPPRSELVATYLAQCVQNIQNRKYTNSPLGITGPCVFGDTLTALNLNLGQTLWLRFGTSDPIYVYKLCSSPTQVLWSVKEVKKGRYRITPKDKNEQEQMHCINCEYGQQILCSGQPEHFASSWWSINESGGLQNVFTKQVMEVDGSRGWTLRLISNIDDFTVDSLNGQSNCLILRTNKDKTADAVVYNPATNMYLSARRSDVCDVNCREKEQYNIYNARGKPIIKHKFDNANGGDWSEVVNSNDYGLMWRKRQVYGE